MTLGFLDRRPSGDQVAAEIVRFSSNATEHKTISFAPVFFCSLAISRLEVLKART